MEIKKNIISSILIFTIVNCIAQPNPGFENWHTEYSYQVPDSWQTYNMLSLTLPPNPLSAFKASGLDTHSGNYSLKLKSIFVNNNPAPGSIDDTIGGTYTAKIIVNPYSTLFGFPYVGRPEKLEFWAKYFPIGNDIAGAGVVLQKWNGSGHDTIASGEIEIMETVSYTLFEFTLTYFSEALPDTAAIAFVVSRHPATARVNSTLYVDDISLTGWVGIDEKEVNKDKVKVFPNPAKDNITIFTEIKDASNVLIVDITGKPLARYVINDFSAKINTSMFNDGVYFYYISDKKDRVLFRDKFDVIK